MGRKVEERRLHCPLDIVGSAARIVTPVIHGINTGARMGEVS